MSMEYASISSRQQIEALEPISAEKKRQWKTAMEQVRRHRQAMQTEQGEKPLPESWELLNELRNERTRELDELG